MRPRGSTRAKKTITDYEFYKLLSLIKANKKIKSSTKEKLKIAFTLLYVTGCRISEISSMTKEDLLYMIQNKEYSLTNKTKTKKPRLITFSDSDSEIQLLLDIIPKKDGYLFCKNKTQKPMSKKSLTRLCNNFLHTHLGKLYSTHSFRKGYITILHQMGESLETIRQDIGHVSIVTTARYTEVSTKEIAHIKSKRNW